MTTIPHAPPASRPVWYVLVLGVLLPVAASIPVASAMTLRRAVANEFLYEGVGMILAAIATAAIAVVMILAGLRFLTRPRVRPSRRALAGSILLLIGGPIAATVLYMINCLLEC